MVYPLVAISANNTNRFRTNIARMMFFKGPDVVKNTAKTAPKRLIAFDYDRNGITLKSQPFLSPICPRPSI